MTITPTTRLRSILPAMTSLLIGSSVLACGAHAAPARFARQESIKSVALTTADVTRIYGSGFRAFINGVISNKDLASLEKTAKISSGVSMSLAGRVTGYDSVWFRGNRTSSLSVTNGVNEYQNSSLPLATFGQFKHVKPIKGLTFHASPLGGVGDEAYVLTIRTHGSSSIGIIFRRGRYLAEIMAGGRHVTVRLSSLSRLAAIEDQRIQARG